MNESAVTFPSYTNPIHPNLRLRLEDVVLTNIAEVKIIVTADAASANTAQQQLQNSLRGVSVTSLGNHQFSICAVVPCLNHTSSPPDSQKMFATAINLVSIISSAASLDLRLCCTPAVAALEGNKHASAVKISLNTDSIPSEHLRYVLANTLSDRLDDANLNLKNATGGVETEREMEGHVDYVTCNLIAHTSHDNIQAATTAAKKLSREVAGTLGLAETQSLMR